MQFSILFEIFERSESEEAACSSSRICLAFEVILQQPMVLKFYCNILSHFQPTGCAGSIRMSMFVCIAYHKNHCSLFYLSEDHQLLKNAPIVFCWEVGRREPCINAIKIIRVDE